MENNTTNNERWCATFKAYCTTNGRFSNMGLPDAQWWGTADEHKQTIAGIALGCCSRVKNVKVICYEVKDGAEVRRFSTTMNV